MNRPQDTIAALCTPPGSGALGVIRVSGPVAVTTVDSLFSKSIAGAKGYTLHYGQFRRPDGSPLDDVLLSVFRAPRSFTREETVEISFHGSPYILREALTLLTAAGCRLAEPGEFTRRAFLNGAFDLAQAEAVADLIAAESAAQHRVALNQLRGGVSRELAALREELLNFVSLIELELDFAEEDVEFADRLGLRATVERIQGHIGKLADTFRYGNALKKGIPVVIAGKPNAGKSTLLNALLNEERAIVSDIAGTTRDMIEDEVTIEGVSFRFVDTAGLRATDDPIERIGVERAEARIRQATLLLYLTDLHALHSPADWQAEVAAAQAFGVPFLMIGNKHDLLSPEAVAALTAGETACLPISARAGSGMEALKAAMLAAVGIHEHASPDQVIVTSARHADALARAREALLRVTHGLDTGLTGDFLALDIRAALFHIGSITGEITNDDILGNIFSKFCIGK